MPEPPPVYKAEQDERHAGQEEGRESHEQLAGLCHVRAEHGIKEGSERCLQSNQRGAAPRDGLALILRTKDAHVPASWPGHGGRPRTSPRPTGPDGKYGRYREGLRNKPGGMDQFSRPGPVIPVPRDDLLRIMGPSGGTYS
ncbi:hypothetical protein IBTHAUMO2_1090001 [Nitrosopumilaceae archaeon]|nr:hypothetical protein IBTHAUMO2_1090001 [Nitrosopumilaceae archaeon]